MSELLAEGCDVDALDECESTPLHCTARNGHVPVIDILLQHGASVDRPDIYGWTPLTIAVVSRRLEAAQKLLDEGARVDALARDGECLPEDSLFPDSLRRPVTPLFFAAHAADNEMVQRLLDTGADLFQRNWEGWSPLSIAAEQGHAETLSVRLERRNVDIEPAELTQTLCVASENGYLPVIKVLVYDRFIDGNDGLGYLPRMLSLAARHGHSDVVCHLLEYQLVKNSGVDFPPCRDNDGKTPLILAIEGKHQWIARCLLAPRQRS